MTRGQDLREPRNDKHPPHPAMRSAVTATQALPRGISITCAPFGRLRVERSPSVPLWPLSLASSAATAGQVSGLGVIRTRLPSQPDPTGAANTTPAAGWAALPGAA